MSALPESLFQEYLSILLVAFIFVGTIFWVWMLLDCANQESTGNERIVWILILLIANVIGAVIYYFVRRPRRFVGAGK